MRCKYANEKCYFILEASTAEKVDMYWTLEMIVFTVSNDQSLDMPDINVCFDLFNIEPSKVEEMISLLSSILDIKNAKLKVAEEKRLRKLNKKRLGK